MCRRCSECDGYSHHWLPNGSFGDEREENNEAAFECKHCNALGDECPDCLGDGCVASATKPLAIPIRAERATAKASSWLLATILCTQGTTHERI
jgi:hypothetical protein